MECLQRAYQRRILAINLATNHLLVCRYNFLEAEKNANYSFSASSLVISEGLSPFLRSEKLRLEREQSVSCAEF